MKETLPARSEATVPRWARSPDIWVMFAPTSAYRWLVGVRGDRSGRGAAARAVFVAFVIGCMVSLVTVRSLALRLVADGTLNGLVLVVVQVAALAAVCWRKRGPPFAWTVERFFMGFGPWLLWMVLFSGLWAAVPPIRAFSPMAQQIAHYSVFVIILWSCSIDFAFFRWFLGRSALQATRDLLVQRAIAWTAMILVFGGGPMAAELTRIFRG